MQTILFPARRGRRVYSPALTLQWRFGICCGWLGLVAMAGCAPSPKTLPPRTPLSKITPTEGHGSNLPMETPQQIPLRITPSERPWISAGQPGNRVALTFDAGGEPDGYNQILAALAARRVRVTFFLTGQFVEKFPEAARAIAQAGHELGNHSYSHPAFTRLSETEIATQLAQAEQVIKKICGRSAKPLFRFPYGESNRYAETVVMNLGYQAVSWSLDSLDSVDPPKTASYLVERVLRRTKPGMIVLLHIGVPATAEALPQILDGLKEKGLEVVPISVLMQNIDERARL
jgi:peptidoglycan/xylan/chitin deacetylase (PgdA/CDA1 family)